MDKRQHSGPDTPESRGLIFDIKGYSIHDGLGIRTTVFFKGCPLHCRWCHNPESQSPAVSLIWHTNRCIRCGACADVCPHGAIGRNGKSGVTDRATCRACMACTAVCYAEARQCVGRSLTVAEALAEIQRDVPFYDESGGGVTFSGGEPLLQGDFLQALLQACRAQGIRTAVDTCGYADWAVLDRIRAHVDLFLYDLKLLDSARHRQHTGVPNELIMENLRRLAQHGHTVIVRVPIIPGVTDDPKNIRQIGEFMAATPPLRRVDLLPYHHSGIDKYARLNRSYSLTDVRPPSAEQMTAIARRLEAFGLEVKIGG